MRNLDQLLVNRRKKNYDVMEETRPADRVLDRVDSRGRKATINEGITSSRKRDLSTIF